MRKWCKDTPLWEDIGVSSPSACFSSQLNNKNIFEHASVNSVRWVPLSDSRNLLRRRLQSTVSLAP